jgi:hypothetical protein
MTNSDMADARGKMRAAASVQKILLVVFQIVG